MQRSVDEIRISRMRPAANARPGADRLVRAGFGVMLMLTLAVYPLAAPAIAVAAAKAPKSVSVSLDKEGGQCHAQGEFHAAVSVAIAWQVLTDYEGITRFVPAVRESKLEQGPDGERRLRQDAMGSAFMLEHRVHVLLQLDEVADKSIAFRDLLGKDFREYSGEWRLVPDASGVHVEYELRAEPSSSLMRLFCRGALKKGAEDLLGQVRTEMLRRGTSKQS